MKTSFMIPDPESVDLSVKENTGADPISLRLGYRVLGGGPERCRDQQLSGGQNLVENEDGGFLGRTVSPDSESSEL